MIEDIEGATSEPVRRGHVLALSSAIAAISFVLLLAIVVVPSRVGTPAQPVAPAAASAAPATTVTFGSSPISQLRLDLTRDSVCSDGTRLIPPYYIAVNASTGDMSAVRSIGGTTRSVPVRVLADPRTPWLRVTCATPDSGDDH